MSDFGKDNDFDFDAFMKRAENLPENDGDASKKEYDLDYFAEHEKKEPTDLTENDAYDINALTAATDINSGIEFISESEEEADVSLEKFAVSTDAGNDVDEKKEKTKKTVKKVLKAVGISMLSLMLMGVITGCIVVGAFAVYVFNFVDDTVHENLDDLKLDFTTTIYVKDETAESGWVEYKRLHSAENRIWVGFDDMTDTLQNSFVAVEDKRFREHEGVDWKRTVSAFGNMFLHFYSSNQGGSTITQQLVKNLTGDDKDSPMRKIREIMRARYLESHYEKDTILECYLNTICLGGGVYGVEVAANYYFGKSADELTLVECAALAAIPKNPEKYRPDTHPKDNKSRRDTVLRLMYEQGYISEADYKEARDTELVVVADKSVKSSSEVNSYFVDALIDQVIDDLVDTYNYDESYASKNFFNGGYKIYCTLDPTVQKAMDDEYSNTKKYFSTKSKKHSDKTVQSAMTIMDYEGHILGMIGGGGEKTENRGYNRATMAYRQPGSTMKPMATYSQALQKNLIYYSMLVEDSPLKGYYPDGSSGPKNSGGHYSGNVTVASALERSINTIPCKLVKQMGVESTYYWLGSLGIDNLDGRNDMNLSALGLGGTTTGITVTQSAAAYAVFGNLGKYYAPSTYTVVTDQHGSVVLRQEDGVNVMDENTACIMNHLLQNVVYGSSGTGTIAKGFSDTMKCYAKTGTSSEVVDCWFAGGTPYYVGSCWFGFDESENVSPSTLAKQMWTNVMKTLHKDLEPKEFTESEFVTKRYYCRSSGLLATTGCTDVSVGYYKTNYSLPAACTWHEGTLLGPVIDKEDEDEDEKSSSSSGSTSSSTESKKESKTENTSSGNQSSKTESNTSGDGNNSQKTTTEEQTQ